MLLFFLIPNAAAAQVQDSVRLRAELRRGIERLQQLDAQTSTLLANAQDTSKLRLARPLLESRGEQAERMRAILDSIVPTKWGARELAALESDFPGSVLLGRYGAVQAINELRFDDAVARYQRLLRAVPDEAGLHFDYAVLLERMGRVTDARIAFIRAWELAPEDPRSFRALVRLGAEPQSLEDLLERVRRLQARVQKSSILEQHAAELLYKLGRKP